MARIALPFAALLAAGLAACTTYDPYYSSTPTPNAPVVTAVPATPVVAGAAGTPVTTSATTVTSPTVGQIVAAPVAVAPVAPAPSGALPSPATFRPGAGTVESVSLMHLAPSASAGASAPERTSYRLSVRMDDGTVQSIDQDNRAFMVGDRVDIASTGRITRR